VVRYFNSVLFNKHYNTAITCVSNEGVYCEKEIVVCNKKDSSESKETPLWFVILIPFYLTNTITQLLTNTISRLIHQSQSQSHFSTNSQSVSQSIRLVVKPILGLLTRNLSLSGVFIEN
jgi:hypothetical protein